MSPRRGNPLPRGFAPRKAPGNLALVQEFVNTRDVAKGQDALANPQRLEAWLAARELLTGDEPVSEEDWKNALALREGLRKLIRSHNRGAGRDLSAVEELNRVASQVELTYRFLFQEEGSPILVSVTPGWPGTMTRLLGWIAEAEEAGRWARLRSCHAETCQRIFYDSSDNRSGKWCNPRRCGNRAHTRTYRRRKPVWRRGN